MLVVGCFEPDDGREPELDRIYFPTGAVLTPDGSRLYVANSDWDLQFNSGSLQVYDAEKIREQLPTYCDTSEDCDGGQFCPADTATTDDNERPAAAHWCLDEGSLAPCGDRGVQGAGSRLIEPGLCESLDSRTEGLLLDSVGIGAFATTLMYRQNPSGGGRLFIPVRSDATLHWIDVGEGSEGPELDCGQDSGLSGQRANHCDDNHRRGDERHEESADQATLPIEPFGLAASTDGQLIVTSHQSSGSLGLFTNDWDNAGEGPVLRSVFDNLIAREVLDVAAIPVPQAATLSQNVQEYQPGFLVSYRQRARVQLVRYFDGSDSAEGVPFLQATNSTPQLAPTGDVRSIAIDDSERKQCEASCSNDEQECLEQCARVSLDMFFVNQRPATLLRGNTLNARQGSLPGDFVRVASKIVVGTEPTKVVLGSVQTADGIAQRRAFVLSFGASTISIVDPQSSRVEKVAFTGRGPTSIAIDEERGLGYVTHFTDSYLGVLDLNRDHATYGTMILSLGTPTAPRGDR